MGLAFCIRSGFGIFQDRFLHLRIINFIYIRARYGILRTDLQGFTVHSIRR